MKAQLKFFILLTSTHLHSLWIAHSIAGKVRQAMKGVMARWSYSDGWKFQNRRVGEGENHVKWATARATAEGEGESCSQIECDDSTTLTCVPTPRLFHPSDACVDIKSEIQTLKYHWRTSPPVAECFCYSRHSKKPNHRYQPCV